MLISRVPEDGGAGEGREVIREDDDHSHEYRTANELFELMSKNHTFTANDEPLTTGDLVILYQNIDLGTRLMSNVNELKRPNQRVETVVYNEDIDSDTSELSEICSSEDLNDVFLINKERINLLNNLPSLENPLCHKLGDFDIQSDVTYSDYDKHFLFKDPYIKEQLNSLKLMSNSKELDSPILPSSLLDYICCKRLEDNYNFYMDSIIRYVKHTIEQLKRISNGDYLTENTKKKWREVSRDPDSTYDSNTKILAKSTSIPLHVERKITGHASTWDDIVHSEVDIRSLSKILEKKIILEVPKIICGSYRLFSKRCADNLIISCKRDNKPTVTATGEESCVDVVVQLKRSDSGHVMSDINSIMILQRATLTTDESNLGEVMPLPIPESEEEKDDRNKGKLTIIELDEHKLYCDEDNREIQVISARESDSKIDVLAMHITEAVVETTTKNNKNSCNIEEQQNTSRSNSNKESSESSIALREILDNNAKNCNVHNEAAFKLITPDELRLTMQRLNIQSALPEETGEESIQTQNIKRKSPTRPRIKSPYENQSYIVEEKKRKKLLEIREKREKKKKALSENCKIMKHKYGKGAIMAQPSNSVTKLSITNKSFYNSIYGQNTECKQSKIKTRKAKKESVLDIAQSMNEEETAVTTPVAEQNAKKYINRSYYLDDADTEIMYMQMKQEDTKEACSTSTSVISSPDFGANLCILSQSMSPSLAEFKAKGISRTKSITHVPHEGEDSSKKLLCSQSILNVAPANSPKNIEHEEADDELKKSTITVECRKSIDKLYDLMKFGKTDTVKEMPSNPKVVKLNVNKIATHGRGSSTIPGSDSGTSLKHHLTSSEVSGFSFEKSANTSSVGASASHKIKKIPENPIAVPKVIISTKLQKIDGDKYKKDHKKSVAAPKAIPDNPLKAISQLLHEFDSVQKIRNKAPDNKLNKKQENVMFEPRIGIRQNTAKRMSRFDQHREHEQAVTKTLNTVTPRDRKPAAPAELPKIPHQQVPTYDRNIEKNAKKKISDIIDEAKEARGEAVRGPSKNSRINTLAQPKRSYVQAHSEEYQTRYGRNLMADRLQRLASAQPTVQERININARNKRRINPDAVSSVSIKQPPQPVPPLERSARFRHSNSSSPEGKRTRPLADLSCKPNHVSDTPEILKDKMVAVESYVKIHYGNVTPAAAENDHHIISKSRVPLVPNDIELASLTSSPMTEESTALGSKLHNIIDSMIISNAPALSALSEDNESISNLSKDADDSSIAENIFKDDYISLESDEEIDTFKNIFSNSEDVCTNKQVETSSKKIDALEEKQYEIQSFNSATEMQRLEDALSRCMSIGTFQKRLRIKNLTLTPKQSMQQVVLIQSGDANSYILKTSLSQNFKTKNRTKTSDLNTLHILSKSNLNWGCANIPTQIATVGYAFPQYQCVQNTPNCKITSQSLKDIKTKENNVPTQINFAVLKNNQCIKESELNLAEQSVQTQLNEFTIISSVNDSECNEIRPPSDQTESNDITLEKNENKLNDDTQSNANETETVQCKDGEKVTQHSKIENKLVNFPNGKSDNIEYTTSLDMLVGLLNEIQKITCQTQINTSDEQCMQLESILNNNTASLGDVRSGERDFSITSFEKIRHLDKSPSIYSLYLSNNGNRKTNYNNPFCNDKPIYVDKEINADVQEKHYTHTFTEVPSQCFPITINQSTNITNSLIGLLSQPSNQSMYSFNDYHTLYSNSNFNSQKKIIELGYGETVRDSFHESVITQKFEKLIEDEKEPNIVETQEILIEQVQTKQNERGIPKRGNIEKKSKCFYESKFDYGSKDPLIKIKRDILVTVYSMLVLTVFAALSFPELLYHA